MNDRTGNERTDMEEQRSRLLFAYTVKSGWILFYSNKELSYLTKRSFTRARYYRGFIQHGKCERKLFSFCI